MSAQDLEQRARELLAAESRGRREADTMLGPDVASEAAIRAIVAALRQQPAPVDLEFAAWLAKEMPAGTVIGDPVWWAKRIARQYAKRTRQPATVEDDAMRELIEAAREIEQDAAILGMTTVRLTAALARAQGVQP